MVCFGFIHTFIHESNWKTEIKIPFPYKYWDKMCDVRIQLLSHCYKYHFQPFHYIWAKNEIHKTPAQHTHYTHIICENTFCEPRMSMSNLISISLLREMFYNSVYKSLSIVIMSIDAFNDSKPNLLQHVLAKTWPNTLYNQI